jgi:hypothetical protein
VAKSKSYLAVDGIDYPPNKRVEAGEVVDDLPSTSIKWLLDCGAITEISDVAPTKDEV